MNGRRLVKLQLAGFLTRGTLGHGYSLVTMRHDEEGDVRARKRDAVKGVWPLALWNGNAKRCTNQAPAANQSAELRVTRFVRRLSEI